MKNVIMSLLKIIVLVIVFFIVTAVFGALLPLSFDMVAALSLGEQPLFMPLYLLNIFINMSVLFITLKCLRFRKWTLVLAASVSFYGLFIVVNLLEIVWYHEAFPMYTSNDLVKMFLSSPFAYAAAALVGTWLVKGFKTSEPKRHTLFDVGRFGWKIALFMVLYPPFYYFCGFIAWSFSAVRTLYAEWAATMESTWILLLFNVLRGGLWLLFSVPLLLGATTRKRAFWLMPLVLVTATALAYITPNPSFPPMVRVAHGIELTLSMAVVGMFMVMLFLKKKM
jgi:hypothetical protein